MQMGTVREGWVGEDRQMGIVSMECSGRQEEAEARVGKGGWAGQARGSQDGNGQDGGIPAEWGLVCCVQDGCAEWMDGRQGSRICGDRMERSGSRVAGHQVTGQGMHRGRGCK